MFSNWPAQPLSIFKNLAFAEEQGRGEGGKVMALRTSCRTSPLPRYWGCAGTLDIAVGMCVCPWVCVHACFCAYVPACVCASVRVPRSLCMCVHGCVAERVPVCEEAVARLPGELVVPPASSVAV